MPRTTQQFDTRTIGEIPLLTMDFSLNLASGETLSTATWACTSVSGTDDGSNRIVGSPLVGTNATSQLITFVNGVSNNNRYLITCTVTTSLNETLIGYSDIVVTAAS